MVITLGFCKISSQLRTKIPIGPQTLGRKWFPNRTRPRTLPAVVGVAQPILRTPSVCLDGVQPRFCVTNLNYVFRREFNTFTVSLKTVSHGKRTEKQESEKTQDTDKKKDGSPLVLLIENADSDTVMTVSLKQAERIAKRRGLKLVQVQDPTLKGKATSKLVYKIVTGKEHYEISRANKETKSSSGIKGEKMLTIGGKIAPNDLDIRLKNIEKWITKGFQIKVTITGKGASTESMEEVFSAIEKSLVPFKGRILQYREKLGDLKFYIAPPAVEKAKKKLPEDKINSSEHEDSEKI